jgi:hypothetical protein
LVLWFFLIKGEKIQNFARLNFLGELRIVGKQMCSLHASNTVVQ